jgi:hypothetical protein
VASHTFQFLKTEWQRELNDYESSLLLIFRAIRPEKLFQVSYKPGQNRDDLPRPVGYNPNIAFSSELQTKGTDTELIVKVQRGYFESTMESFKRSLKTLAEFSLPLIIQ